MIYTEHSVNVLRDMLLALSRLHSHGALYATEAAIASESGYLEHDVHIVMRDAEGHRWVATHDRGKSWRLVDRVVAVTPLLRDCDACGLQPWADSVPAVADARTSDGRWANVCTQHFIELGCTLGEGRGQFLRLDY